MHNQDKRLPRWLYRFGLAAAIVILLLLALHLAGGGADHGPARHLRWR